MPNKSRIEINSEIWDETETISGSSGWDFKQYVLGILFYRFISENLTNYINENQRNAGIRDFDYAVLKDDIAIKGRAEAIAEKGFFILPSELFTNIKSKSSEDANLNETLANIFRNIESSAIGTSSENAIRGLFDEIEVNSNKLGETVAKKNSKIASLLKLIGEWDLGNYSQETLNYFGDTYEHLITMYASTAGKKGGDFFTPTSVSELLTRITLINKETLKKVYDPACGSGSLLLKFASILGDGKVENGYYGQDENLTFYNLCRMNMFLHNINFEKFDIAHGDTLLNPKHWDDQPFDAIVSNPRFSKEWKGSDDILLINDPRFSPAGVLAPKSKHDMAFIMHTINWLAPDGIAALAQHPGVMYRSGAEKSIREYLISNNYVDCVIQLPHNLFFGVTIAPCILVLKKNKSDKYVLFVNAENEFGKLGSKNILREEDISKIINWLILRDTDTFNTALIHNDEIAVNNYLLTVTSYVKSDDTREKVNIKSLNDTILRVVTQQNLLREKVNETVGEIDKEFN